MTGMIEGVLGFEIFDLGIFGVGKFWQVFFGIFGVFKTNVSIFCVMSFNAPWKFLCLGNSAWDFWGVKCWSRDFFEVLFEALRIFSGFDFCPHSIIPVT